MSKNVLFIGFMGVGKGTLARAFAKETDRLSIDTDDIIESFEKKRIKNIFEQEGEGYFRAKEQLCAAWLEKNVTNSIISTGGGFYKVENLKKIGTIVYLEASFDFILSRLLSSPNAKAKLAKRPLLKDKIKAKKIYDERIQEYEKLADIILHVEKNRLLESIQKLKKELQHKGII